MNEWINWLDANAYYWRDTLTFSTPRIEPCERLRGTGTAEVWQNGKLTGKIVNIKDTTMKMICENAEKCGDKCIQVGHFGVHKKTPACFGLCTHAGNNAKCIPYKPKETTVKTSVSYQDLKEAGACEKGLIWFVERFGDGPSVDLKYLRKLLGGENTRNKIRDIYHADPDAWVRWLDEHFPEEEKFKYEWEYCDGKNNRFGIFIYMNEKSVPKEITTSITKFSDWLHHETHS